MHALIMGSHLPGDFWVQIPFYSIIYYSIAAKNVAENIRWQRIINSKGVVSCTDLSIKKERKYNQSPIVLEILYLERKVNL